MRPKMRQEHQLKYHLIKNIYIGKIFRTSHYHLLRAVGNNDALICFSISCASPSAPSPTTPKPAKPFMPTFIVDEAVRWI